MDCAAGRANVHDFERHRNLPLTRHFRFTRSLSHELEREQLTRVCFSPVAQQALVALSRLFVILLLFSALPV